MVQDRQVLQIFHRLGVRHPGGGVCNSGDLSETLAHDLCEVGEFGILAPKEELLQHREPVPKDGSDPQDVHCDSLSSVLSCSTKTSQARAVSSNGSFSVPTVSRFLSNKPIPVILRDIRVRVRRWELV